MTEARTASVVDAQFEVLESGVRLSQSVLWRLQEEYYSTRGLDAWDSVPFHATSSAYACDTYAEMILSVLLDCAPHFDPQAPLWVIELGAGTGCFSWRTLRALNAKRAQFRALANLDLRYVMTDFTSSIVRSWRRNPNLHP
jgi:hypothetical protein